MEKREKAIDWEEMSKLIVKLANKMTEEEFAKFQAFKLDYQVTERLPDQYYLRIGNEEYHAGYIFLRDRFLVYKEGRLILEVENK